MDTINLMICAIAVAGLDICALVIILASYFENRSGRKRWSRISADMELVVQEKIYPLECDEILVGRHASADIRIVDLSVSRYHAVLNVSDGKWFITDLGSKSGIYINGAPVQNARLHENDVITLGKCNAVFRKRRIDNGE